MTFKTWVIGLINAVLPEPGQPVKEAAFREAIGATVDPDDDQWRRLSGDAQRDLAPMTQLRMQKMAHYLWEQNLLANRLIELPVAFLLAEGVQLVVDDEENQKALDRFWFDPINDMDQKLPKKARELALFGEQCYPVFVNEHSGAVRLGYLDPQLIATVVMDPDNPEQPIGVVTAKDKKGNARRYRVIINGEEDAFSARTQKIRETFTDGDALFVKVNDLCWGSRGRSDLLAQADWLDAYDQFMFGELERQVMMRAFIWDVTLENADEATVRKRAKEISSPAPGSVRVHNSSEKWSAEAPDLKSYDSTAAARLFRTHMMGGASLPEHWYAAGGDVNRATASEMDAPTLKVFTMRQKVLKHMLESIGRYALFRKAKAEGQEADFGDKAWQVQAIFPELSEKDLTKQATALQQIITACGVAIASKLITRKFALQLLGVVSAKLGVELDVDQMLADAEEEAKKNQVDDGFSQPPTNGDLQGAGAAAMQEALDVIKEFADTSNARFAEIQAAAAAGGDGGAAALKEAIAEQSMNTTRLVEALVSRKDSLELVLKHGKTSKTITTPGGEKFVLQEQDVDA